MRPKIGEACQHQHLLVLTPPRQSQKVRPRMASSICAPATSSSSILARYAGQHLVLCWAMQGREKEARRYGGRLSYIKNAMGMMPVALRFVCFTSSVRPRRTESSKRQKDCEVRPRENYRELMRHWTVPSKATDRRREGRDPQRPTSRANRGPGRALRDCHAP